MERKTVFGLEEIYTLLPHRPPFLFVDRVVQFSAERLIMTERLIRDDEPWFAGHFPGKPIMPGVLVTDALAQTAGLLWGFSKRARGGAVTETPEIFFLASVNVKFVSPALPGTTLLMRAERQFGALFSYTVEATAGRNVVAKGSLTLAMMEGKL